MLLTLLLAFIAFLVGADELMLGPILEPIGVELGVKPERVTLFITTYSVALAIVAPLFGALSDKVGRRVIILPAIVVFGGASILTGLVTSFEWGLVARVITVLPVLACYRLHLPSRQALVEMRSNGSVGCKLA